PYDFASKDRGGQIKAGEPLHEMWIRLTIDEDMLIHAVEAVTDWGPFSMCGAIAADFSRLQGLSIGKGFLGEVRKRFAGTHGCTHRVELFGPIATTAYQALYPARERKAREGDGRERPGVIDTCHALAADGPVVRRLWPDFYTGS
ncbi:MAG: DUF2889 domain-containing protein, partial [Rhodospirillales bacterium]|nr:DUF2889 domain-containing protein [Rhodospirillales bacterium]